MHKLEAVFWDIDGTIADTEMYGHRVAFNKAFEEEGLDWRWNESTYANLLKIHGGPNRIRLYSLNLHMKLEESRIKKGDNILFSVFGAGFAWGSAVLKW